MFFRRRPRAWNSRSPRRGMGRPSTSGSALPHARKRSPRAAGRPGTRCWRDENGSRVARTLGSATGTQSSTPRPAPRCTLRRPGSTGLRRRGPLRARPRFRPSRARRRGRRARAAPRHEPAQQALAPRSRTPWRRRRSILPAGRIGRRRRPAARRRDPPPTATRPETPAAPDPARRAGCRRRARFAFGGPGPPPPRARPGHRSTRSRARGGCRRRRLSTIRLAPCPRTASRISWSLRILFPP